MALDERDFVAFIEACYRVEQPLEAWMAGVAGALGDVIGNGLGVHAWEVDLGAPEGQQLRNPLLAGGREDWQERWRKDRWDAFMAPQPADAVRLIHSIAPVCVSSDLWKVAASQSETYDQYLRSFEARGRERVRLPTLAAGAPGDTPVSAVMYPDSFNVGGLEPSGRGSVLSVNLASVAPGPLTDAEIAVWGRMAAHMATGFRLRERLAAAPTPPAPDAILDARGKVHDATPELRDTLALKQLRDSVVRITHARERGRNDLRAATEAWQALAEGRWSLVDHFERDGRRYYLARPNVPSAESVGLSDREAQVANLAALGHANKLIAYELGVSASTVATHLAKAATKLGVSSRVDLIRAMRKRAG